MLPVRLTITVPSARACISVGRIDVGQRPRPLRSGCDVVRVQRPLGVRHEQRVCLEGGCAVRSARRRIVTARGNRQEATGHQSSRHSVAKSLSSLRSSSTWPVLRAAALPRLPRCLATSMAQTASASQETREGPAVAQPQPASGGASDGPPSFDDVGSAIGTAGHRFVHAPLGRLTPIDRTVISVIAGAPVRSRVGGQARLAGAVRSVVEASGGAGLTHGPCRVGPFACGTACASTGAGLGGHCCPPDNANMTPKRRAPRKFPADRACTSCSWSCRCTAREGRGDIFPRHSRNPSESPRSRRPRRGMYLATCNAPRRRPHRIQTHPRPPGALTPAAFDESVSLQRVNPGGMRSQGSLSVGGRGNSSGVSRHDVSAALGSASAAPSLDRSGLPPSDGPGFPASADRASTTPPSSLPAERPASSLQVQSKQAAARSDIRRIMVSSSARVRAS